MTTNRRYVTALRLAHLHVEATQERLRAPVDVLRAGAGAGPPRPDGLVHPAAGKFLDRQADHGALDDRQLSLAVEPSGRPGQLGVEPV